MERKGPVQHLILMLIIIFAGCNKLEHDSEYTEIQIDIDGCSFTTRAFNPREDDINDLTILAYDSYGTLEACEWFEGDEIRHCHLKLLTNKKYSIFACANFGYKLEISSIQDLRTYKYHLAYPDDYQGGIPMTGETDVIIPEKDSRITINLTRLMAKVSLRIDRRELSDNVEIRVRNVTVGNCPKSVIAFGDSRVEHPDECFSMGFYRDAEECSPLNEYAEIGLSKEVSMYMFENLQGKFSDSDIYNDEEKVFAENDPRKDICTYIELQMDYLSSEKKSIEKGLIYRFYLGENLNMLNIERNCHYRITVCPKDDGLNGDGWRVDKQYIVPIGPISFHSWPESYIRGNIGDKVHIGCTFSPSYAPFDVGLEYMMDDREAGIYDFKIDEDGHGAVLTLTGPGRGLIYMEAGEPINDAAMWIIEVNLPVS